MNQKGQATKTMLANSLKRLMRQRSFDKITIQQIAEEAGFIRPTFYNHFRDKYEVVEWIFTEEVITQCEYFFAEGKYREGIRKMLEAMEADKEFYVSAAKIEGQNSFRSFMFRSFSSLLEHILRSRAIQPSKLQHLFQVEVLAEYYANAETFVLMKWLESGMTFSVDDMERAQWFLISVSFEDVVKEISTKV